MHCKFQLIETQKLLKNDIFQYENLVMLEASKKVSFKALKIALKNLQKKIFSIICHGIFNHSSP